ncbi:hypothetical protein BJ912DRAFT_947448 [Pholiota molesta]|nr:hypothetical protein BJ912DRAFT_947448 [Pholiota molesta]
MIPVSLTFILFASIPQILAGSVNKGGSCTPGNSRLQAGTYQFWSDCNSVTFCNDTTNVCDSRSAAKTTFHSDTPKTTPASPPNACQFNRDDQCVGPPNYQSLADTSGRGLNVNGSVCLNNVCLWANKTAGSSCTVENTAYTGYGASGEFIDIVSRGDCMIGLYCDSVSLQCLQSKALGASCSADKECDSRCGETAATPHHFGVYVYILVGLGIIGGMAGTLTGLYFAHRKQREIERSKRAQYWREQNAFHQNLMNMRETARESILSLPRNGGSRDLSDESQTPILQGTTSKHDGSSDFDDGLMYSGKQNDGVRF